MLRDPHVFHQSWVKVNPVSLLAFYLISLSPPLPLGVFAMVLAYVLGDTAARIPWPAWSGIAAIFTLGLAVCRTLGAGDALQHLLVFAVLWGCCLSADNLSRSATGDLGGYGFVQPPIICLNDGNTNMGNNDTKRAMDCVVAVLSAVLMVFCDRNTPQPAASSLYPNTLSTLYQPLYSVCVDGVNINPYCCAGGLFGYGAL